MPISKQSLFEECRDIAEAVYQAAERKSKDSGPYFIIGALQGHLEQALQRAPAKYRKELADRLSNPSPRTHRPGALTPPEGLPVAFTNRKRP